MSQTLKSRIAGWGVLAGSIVLLFLTATTNWFQGEHQGVTEAGKAINSVGSVAIDVMGLMFCGLAAGVCYGIGRRGWGHCFAAALVLSALWSGYSVFSFQATEAMSASKTRATANSRIEEADKLAKDSVSKMTAASVKARSSAARDDFIYGTQEAIKSFRDAPVKVIIAPDAGAETLAARFGWNVETIQQLRAASFAFLIIFLKMIGFPGAGFLLSWSPEPSTQSTAKGSGGGDDGNRKPSEETTDKQPETVVPFPGRTGSQSEFPAAQNQQPNVRSEAPRVLAPAPSVSTNPSLYGASVSTALRLQPEWPSQQAIADALGVSKGKVSKDMKRLKGQRKVETKRNGKSNAVIARRIGGPQPTYA